MIANGDVRSEVGETLVELLIAIVLLGIAGTAVITTITMGVKAASINTATSVDQNVLRNWAEQIAAMPYVDCAVPASYPNVLGVPSGSGATATLIDVEYWNGSTFTGACSTDQGMQQITLEVETPTASVQPKVENLIFVKRGGVNTDAYAP